MKAALLALLPSAAIVLVALVAVQRRAGPSRDPAKVKAELDAWNRSKPESTGDGDDAAGARD